MLGAGAELENRWPGCTALEHGVPTAKKLVGGSTHGENRLFYLEIFFDPGSCATGKLHLDPPLPLTMLYLQNTLY